MAQGTSPWSWSNRETTTGSEPVTLGLDASDVPRYNTPRCLAGWCNGSTTDSGSVSEGSNPSPAALRFLAKSVEITKSPAGGGSQSPVSGEPPPAGPSPQLFATFRSPYSPKSLTSSAGPKASTSWPGRKDRLYDSPCRQVCRTALAARHNHVAYYLSGVRRGIYDVVVRRGRELEQLALEVQQPFGLDRGRGRQFTSGGELRGDRFAHLGNDLVPSDSAFVCARLRSLPKRPRSRHEVLGGREHVVPGVPPRRVVHRAVEEHQLGPQVQHQRRLQDRSVLDVPAWEPFWEEELHGLGREVLERELCDEDARGRVVVVL